MFKYAKTIATAALLTIAMIVSADAADLVTVNDLINNEFQYDGKTVVIEGEAIGEVLERGEYSWINVSDGSNAIGIWLDTEKAAEIAHFGDYKHVGDTVRITGMFSRNCPEHSGEVDIHCQTFEIVKRGEYVRETVSQTKIIVCVILFFVTLGALYLCYVNVYKPTIKKPEQQ
jgi:hypothetical protein